MSATDQDIIIDPQDSHSDDDTSHGIKLNLNDMPDFTSAVELFSEQKKIGKGTYGTVFQVTLRGTDKTYAVKYLPYYTYEPSAEIDVSFRSYSSQAGSSMDSLSSFSSSPYNNTYDSEDMFYDIWYSFHRHTVIINETCVPGIIGSGDIIRYDNVLYIQDDEHLNLFDPPTNLYVGLLMPLYGQGDLHKYIESRPKIDHEPMKFDLTIENNRKLIFSMVESIALCTYHNILHGDIKSQNYLTKSESTAVLADFGLAQTGFCTQRADQLHNVFTLLERPPEVLFGFKYGFKSDVWALGCTLVELFTGKPLFPGSDKEDMVYQFASVFGNFTAYWPEVTFAPDAKLVDQMLDTMKMVDKYNPRTAKRLIQPSVWDRFSKLNLKENNNEVLFMDLIDKMLKINPSSRANIFEIYYHPLFDGYEQKIPHATCYQQSIVNYKSRPSTMLLSSTLDNFRINGLIAGQRHVPYDVYFQCADLAARVFGGTICTDKEEVDKIIISALLLAHYLRYQSDTLPKLENGNLKFIALNADQTKIVYSNELHIDMVNDLALMIVRDGRCKINTSTIYDFWLEYIEHQPNIMGVMRKFMILILVIHSLFAKEMDAKPMRLLNLVLWLTRALYQPDKYDIEDTNFDVNLQRGEWRDDLLHMLSRLEDSTIGTIDFDDIWYFDTKKIYIKTYSQLHDAIKWNTPQTYILPTMTINI